MNVISGGPGDQDPLARWGGVLASATLAFVLSVILAALIAAEVAATYRGRVLAYGLFILWTLTGAVLLFRRTAAREASAPSPRRVALWTISIWLWPLLLLGARASKRPRNPA